MRNTPPVRRLACLFSGTCLRGCLKTQTTYRKSEDEVQWEEPKKSKTRSGGGDFFAAPPSTAAMAGDYGLQRRVDNVLLQSQLQLLTSDPE